MAMKPFSEVKYGYSMKTWRDGSKTLYPLVPSFRKTLTGVYTTTGNFVSPNSHAYTVISESYSKGFVKRYFSDGTVELSEGPGVASVSDSGTMTVHAQFDNGIMDAAYVRLYERVRGTVTGLENDVDLSIDLVTWRETARMLAGWKRTLKYAVSHADRVLPVARRAQYAIDTLNRGRLSRDQAARYTRMFDLASKEVASRHLEYIYGIRPLIGTFHDLAQLAITPPRRHAGLIRCEGFAKARYDIAYVSSEKPPSHCTGIYSERAKVVAYFSPDVSVQQQMSSIGSLNIASALYESTPYSFVLDWFTNTGSWLRSLETAYMHRNNFRGGYATQGMLIAEDGRRTGRSGSYDYNLRRSMYKKMFRRQPLGGLPIPMSPSRRQNFHLDQQLALVSLIRQPMRIFDSVLDARKLMR